MGLEKREECVMGVWVMKREIGVRMGVVDIEYVVRDKI